MYKNRFRGFTLIELLVVIAIIGILSAVVLASLSTARSKGNDAAVKSDLSSIQTQAEIWYGNNGNRYASVAAAGADGLGCTLAGTLFQLDTTIRNAVAAANAANGSGVVTCYGDAAGTVYAISAQLTAPGAGYFCVDSTGNATSTTAAIVTTAC
ncbi:hypothetical protein A3A36_00525 [Candidatus Kaiserbacteria bacterium RIFCSPLOWO2_01_FULL_52_12b]|uniref:Type II secretion system protein GspG C-terminal domain-containing protein n=1 Tax=Candidatus Kaiserbacteria bacterium RIFCSPLOWO2_01_FULL_52_12b TaxID=1798509 RepID=A0A1F6EY36_9BACT|nr:MAG: hypothetical protein A3A36_00525 [Candidatus Kaiserbacteria bacterium RIFCSPLOWO2_01_FULL_52_12b]